MSIESNEENCNYDWDKEKTEPAKVAWRKKRDCQEKRPQNDAVSRKIVEHDENKLEEIHGQRAEPVGFIVWLGVAVE